MTGFALIPVIDLKDGMVVHAREGRREQYRPLRSRLVDGADPVNVVQALLALHPFQTLYIADLDAIERRGDNLPGIRSLRAQYPQLELWADTGIRDEVGLSGWRDAGLGRPVIGSESLPDATVMAGLRARDEQCSAVLSLDFRGAHFQGPPALLNQPERYWPLRVLAMNLHRVGSDHGPDLALIVELAKRIKGCNVYAAGGVRSVDDLERVVAAGAAGALLASALHDGRLDSAALAKFANDRRPAKNQPAP